MRINWVLRLYPPAWRKRYQDEMQAVLEQHTITLTTLLDLLVGSVDARLDPTYRTKEGFMFQRFLDTRALAIAFLCMLAASQFFTSIWITMHHSLSFESNSIEGMTAFLAISCVIAVSVVALVPLLGIAGSIIRDALKNRRWGILLFALLCLILFVGMSLWYVLPINYGRDGFFSDYVIAWFFVFGVTLIPMISLFVTGVKGVELLRKRAWGTVALALVILLLLPTCVYLFDQWSLGMITVPSDTIIFFLAYLLMPFAPLAALLLTLAHDEMSLKSRSVMLVFGSLLGILLAVNLAVIFIWDVNRWMGGAWIFSPETSIWPFFGGQWAGPLFVHMIVQGIIIGVALLSLVYAFIQFARRDRTAQPLSE